MFPKSTHETFSTKLFQNFRGHPRLEKAKFSESDFILSHYAGKVSHILTESLLSHAENSHVYWFGWNIVSFFRSHTKQRPFWRKTVTMLS